MLSMQEITDLDDKQLRAELKNNGVNPGPFGRNRGTYEKKLFKVIHGYDFGKKPTVSTPAPSKAPLSKPVPQTEPAPASKKSRSNSKSRVSETRSQDSQAKPLSSTANRPIKSVSNTPISQPKLKKVINYDNLSDLEIRNRIKDQGGNCGPISTPTIRKLMIKRLRNLDDAAFDAKYNQPVAPAPAAEIEEDQENIAPEDEMVDSPRNEITASFSSADEDENEMADDSIPRPSSGFNSTIRHEAAEISIQASRTFNNTADAGFSTDNTEDDLTEARSPQKILNSGITSPQGKSGSSSKTRNSENSGNFLGSSSKDKTKSRSSTRSTKVKPGTDASSSYSKSFTCSPIESKPKSYLDKKRELARLNAGVSNKSLDEILQPSQAEISSSKMHLEETTTNFNPETKETTLGEYDSQNLNSEKSGSSQPQSIFYKFVNFLPKILLISVIFAGLVGIYTVKKSNQLLGSDFLEGNVLGCQNDDGLCLSKAELDSEAKNLLVKFYEQLNEVAALSKCGETLQDPKIKIIDLLELVGQDQTYHHNHQVVKAVVQEFYNHPKYGVQIFDIDSKILPENLDRLADFSVADSLLIAEPILEHPKCKYHKMKQELYNFVSDCVARILQAVWGGNGKFIISGILVAYVTYKILINAFRKRRAHQAQVKEFVDLIIETVESSGLNDKPVNHIRDQLIHINERQYLAQIWNEALDFVREHESRITFSQKEFNGEFIEIVSWNDPTSKNLASLTFSDSWKGSALPNSSNDLKTTPQNCVALKIRDFYQNSNQINSKPKQEKLLHEIMGQVNLILSHKFKNSADKIWPLHYGFEENAAYLRFNSTEDACHFYNCINAQWYNGNLLTPKFVTDSKYFKRFPSAKKSIFTRI